MAIDKRELSGKHLLSRTQNADDNIGTMRRIEAPNMDNLVQSLQELGVVSFQLDEKNEPSISVNLDKISDASEEQQKSFYNQLAQHNLVPSSTNDPALKTQLLRHGMSIALFPEMAGADILAHTLPENNISPLQIMKTQASLNRLGYDAGSVDGAFGRKSANAIAEFLTDYPKETTYASSSIIGSLGRYLPKEKMDILFEGNESYKPDEADPGNLPRRTAQGYVLMNPEMLRAMEVNPEIRRYVNIAQEAALDPKYGNGLDPNMYANQLWQESLSLIHARPSRGVGIESEKKAVGIAQFIEETGKMYGLDTLEKRKDPILSIRAGAQYMRDLTDQYGSQELALTAYNGGPGGYATFLKGIPKNERSIEKWLKNASEAHAAFVKKNGPPETQQEKGLWHNQTRNYVREIVSDFWAPSRVKRALSMEANQKQMYKPEEQTPDQKRNIEENNARVQHADAGPAVDRLATPEGYEEHLQRLKQPEISFEKPADARFSRLEDAANLNIKNAFGTAAAQPESTAAELDSNLDIRKIPSTSVSVAVNALS
ncbi:MAG: hypothetical protein DI626_05030 [Micavibrio aeruginosavorus]|uniref:Transglycosylase SLT domain-containing protein n=1 Tax=Micavibrio aeruginosavorus TaxID=349221 RepID=A0A2W5BV67_9BACT|nr:MAG: hypothetical protein DI626_05030 [Micavibrio aeruginosavorus]